MLLASGSNIKIQFHLYYFGYRRKQVRFEVLKKSKRLTCSLEFIQVSIESLSHHFLLLLSFRLSEKEEYRESEEKNLELPEDDEEDLDEDEPRET